MNGIIRASKSLLYCILLILILFASYSTTVFARVLKVGPARQYTKPSQAAAVAVDSDTIEIDAGLYAGDAATWSSDDLVIRSVGGRAHLRADGAYTQGKGTWVITGSNTTVEYIEFSGASVPDENGAGIRQEGPGLTVRYCYFHDNENGILGPDGDGEVLIEYSEFANNGFGDGFTHNMYILNADKFTLRYSYIHHAKIGHNVKSRAKENHILYNRIMDESTGTASYAIDLPNGGPSYIIGNLVQQGPNNDNSIIISYGAEGLSNAQSQLYVVNNTIVNDDNSGTFVYVQSGTNPAKLINNLLVGSGSTVSGSAELVTNISSGNPMLVDRPGFDYHLTATSPAIDAGSDPGSANSYSLLPVSQYVHAAATESRLAVGQIDVGAYEYGNMTVPVELGSFSAALSQDGVCLVWQTFSESSNFGFEVQRSRGEDPFETIGFVKGQGWSTQLHSYTFQDRSVVAGSYAYRLKQIDLNGDFEFSPVSKVTVNKPGFFELDQNYPNPFNPETTITFRLDAREHIELTIFNIRGERVAELLSEEREAGEHRIIWNAGNLPGGVYVYQLNKSGTLLRKKLLLLK
jgi:hypothetical protein